MQPLVASSKSPHRRYYDIDVLRFFAAVSVMFLHYLVRGFAEGDNYSPVFYGDAANFVKYNYLAVNLFFMISGFVILMSAENGSAVAFLKSRVTRLYPAYWFCCTVSFVLTYLFINQIFTLTLPRYIFNLTMLNGFVGIGFVDGVYWTLMVELKFYLLVLIVLLLGRISKIEYFLAGWLLISVAQVVLHVGFVERYLITNYSAFFIAGCLFYRISKLGFSLSRMLMLAATVPLGIHFELVDLVRRAAHYGRLEFHPEMVSVICVAFYAVFFVVIRRHSASPTYAKIAGKLGAVSYPLYLIHLNVGMVVFNLFGLKMDKWLLLGLLSVAMIVFAYLINRLVERPLAATIRRLFSKKQAPKTASLA
ncbi:acyltransferase [Herbaspirillum sp. DW155]|uniref:acyltransferase family protein n=1 Tax=Herbaspirillum sp. DW155 TaxID=3095609 RepID=UPI003092323E|nr:acyltransferase [Herbaspirillum sp. DW155]